MYQSFISRGGARNGRDERKDGSLVSESNRRRGELERGEGESGVLYSPKDITPPKIYPPGCWSESESVLRVRSTWRRSTGISPEHVANPLTMGTCLACCMHLILLFEAALRLMKESPIP